MLILFQLLALFLVQFLGNENCFQIIPTLFPGQPKLAIKFSYCHWSILQFPLPPQRTTNRWNVVITTWIVNFMNFCFILIMHDVKVSYCSSFRHFTQFQRYCHIVNPEQNQNQLKIITSKNWCSEKGVSPRFLENRKT